MENVDKIIEELKKFTSDVATLGEPASQYDIDSFEKKYDLKLPEDYKYAIRKANGFSVMGDEVYGIHSSNTPSSLDLVYEREHNAVAYPQFPYIVPFSDDGGGNFYCFDTRQLSKDEQSCFVVFWVSNYQYSDADMPEVVYESFVDFVNEVLIDWTLRDYDYDGNERA